MVHLIKKIISKSLSFIIWKWRGDWRTPYIDLRVKKLTRQARKFKDRHLGESCFIIGNGPSLNVKDLNMIGSIPSFSSNRINLILEKTKWKPYYYIFTDSNMANVFLNELINMKKKQMFMAVTNYGYDALKKHLNNGGHIFLRANRKKDKNGFPKFSDDISKKIFTHGTVTYASIQLAVYMGFKNIYLIGVDHSFGISRKKDGSIHINKELIGKDHFDEKYNESVEYKSETPVNEFAMTEAYISAKKHCDERAVKIYNATRGGKLEVFPRVKFDDLFDNNGNFIG